MPVKSKYKVLIITSMPWRDDNNIGNSYSNIFRGMQDKIEFAHLYCRSGLPQNELCHKYFRINENDLIKNIFYKKPIGEYFELENPRNSPMETSTNTYNRMRILRWEIFFLARNILWSLANWKNCRLDAFIETFKPDIIFGTLTYMPNINKIMCYINEKYNIPIFLYAWDDVYSLKQYSLNPIFWIRRINQRKYIRECVKKSKKLYVINTSMKKEYQQYFNKSCDILYKGYEFEDSFEMTKVSRPIKFVFMGNLGAGRWEALAKLCEVLKKINQEEKIAELLIYTLSPLSDKMKNKLVIDGTSAIMPVVSNEKVLYTMKSADVLVHVEPLNKKDRLFYRLSFSTKLVDYFKAGKCIFAFGGQTASLEYLKEMDAGIVEYSIDNLFEVVNTLVHDKNLIQEYSLKAWNCGKKNHQIRNIQKKLCDDFGIKNNGLIS